PLGKLPVNVIQDILAGGVSVCEAAGIPIAGGHSIDSVEPIYGLVALGVIHPQRIKRNSTACAGDAIVLGKALGVGILSAALKKGALPEEVAPWQQALLWDPQTSGGLLVTCAPQAVASVLSLFRDEGFASAAVIGQMQAGAVRITVDYRFDKDGNPVESQ